MRLVRIEGRDLLAFSRCEQALDDGATEAVQLQRQGIPVMVCDAGLSLCPDGGRGCE
jgi:hypothetical protein